MTVATENGALAQSADIVAMYERERIRHLAPASEESLGANAACSTDVTSTPPTPRLTASPQHPFDDIDDDSDYDQLSDLCELDDNRLLHIHHSEAVRRRAMAADFSEGRLETFVGNPLKELAGTQNQYVSYQVITKVGSSTSSFTSSRTALTYNPAYSPTSSRSKNPNSPSVAASPISSSSGNSSRKSTRNAPSRRYPTSTRWSMYVGTASARTSPRDELTPCIAFSSG